MRKLSFLLLVFITCSCGKAMRERDLYLCHYQQGALEKANAQIDALRQRKRDAVWLLLDRATIQFAAGDANSAAENYRLALEQIDLYNQTCAPEEIGKLLLQDEVAAYSGDDFEQILARIYFALALECSGDRQNAAALLRQTEEKQQEMRSSYSKKEYTKEYQLKDNPLGKLLLALYAEQARDSTNATILYTQAADLLNLSRTESPLFQKEAEKATLLLLCHNGNAPYKISVRTAASVASTIALESFLGNRRTLPASCFIGIPAPELVYDPCSAAIPFSAEVCGCTRSFTTCYDVGAAAHFEWNQKRPNIVARGLARYLLRRVAVEAAYAQNQSAGSALDFAVCMANLMTQADTRTWGTLPLTLDCARFEIPSGLQTITIFNESGESLSASLFVEPNSLSILHLFSLHPGVTKLVMPHTHSGVVP